MEFTATTAVVGDRRGKSSLSLPAKLLEQSSGALLPPPRNKAVQLLAPALKQSLGDEPHDLLKGHHGEGKRNGRQHNDHCGCYDRVLTEGNIVHVANKKERVPQVRERLEIGCTQQALGLR